MFVLMLGEGSDVVVKAMVGTIAVGGGCYSQTTLNDMIQSAVTCDLSHILMDWS